MPDEVLPPSDRGERSETFSLGGGYPRGIAKGCPLKTPRTPAELRQVSFLGGAAPSGHNIFSANRSKMLLSPPKGKGGRRLAPCRFLYSRFFLLASFHLMGVARWPRAVQRHQVLEENSPRVLRQDEWRAVPPGSTGKNDPYPPKRNASGHWGSRGVSPLAGSRGWPRVEGLGREASLPSLAFWELFLHRKSSPGGPGGGAPPFTRKAGHRPAREGRRSRPPPPLAEGHRFPPARASLCKEAKRPARKRLTPPGRQ